MSDKPHRNGDAFFAAVDAAISHDKAPVRLTAEELNTMTRHVAVLLDDAVAAFRRQSHGTCVFLAITAMEETAKAEVLAFRGRPESPPNRRGDPMLNHAKKHFIAIRPTTFFGRLPKILGDEVCARLQREAEAGGFNRLREQALYIHLDHSGVTTPVTVVDRARARGLVASS